LSAGVSVFLILAGAILRFAVSWSPKNVDLQVIGVILVIGGLWLTGKAMRALLFGLGGQHGSLIATVRHGAEALLASIVMMLLVLATMSFHGKLPQSSSLNVELVGLYWHFVDIIWVALFFLFYIY